MGAGLITLPRDRAPATARTRVGTGAALAAITVRRGGAAPGVVRARPAATRSTTRPCAAWGSRGTTSSTAPSSPAARVSIDKIPVDLWLQVASAKLFGFSSIATRLPEALAGASRSCVLYDLVRRLFGRTAGLGAAAALAVLPVAVLTARSDTMDSAMMALDVAAAWLVVWGAQTRRAWPIVAAGAVMGLSFNVKLFEGLVILPALALLAVLAGDLPWRRRAAAMAGGLAAFVVVGAGLDDDRFAETAERPALADRVDQRQRLERRLRLQRRGPAAQVGVRGRARSSTRRARCASSRPRATTTPPWSARRSSPPWSSASSPWPPWRSAPGAPAPGASPVPPSSGLWLIVGRRALSKMQRFEPRYLEAVDPAIAATLGAGVGWLAARAAQRARRGARPRGGRSHRRGGGERDGRTRRAGRRPPRWRERPAR